jgi:hypothetical protein
MSKLIEIKKSTNPDKKLMAVFEITKDGKKTKKTTHFGSSANKDYILYTKEDGKEKANQMRDAYLKRHIVNENWDDFTSAGSLSRYILWEKPTIEASIKFFKSKFKL